jgi:hypothetical protein
MRSETPLVAILAISSLVDHQRPFGAGRSGRDLAQELKGGVSRVHKVPVRRTPAGATLTRVLTAHVTESKGCGCIVRNSVFVQISVVKDDLPMRDPVLDNASP